MIRRFRKLLNRHGFETAPVQAAWARARLGLESGSVPSEMIVLTPNGNTYGGADALIQISRGIWWAWPLVAVSKLPGIKPVLRALYRGVAARRNCAGKTCKLKS